MRLAFRTLAFLLVLLGGLPLAAQQSPTARIVGRVVDATTGAGIVGVNIQIVGTTTGTTSGLDGRFAIANLSPGVVSLQARRIGYTPKTITGLVVDAGQAVDQNIALGASSTVLQATVVTASAERGTVAEALDQQRSASGIVNSVTAEQIQRSPDGNAAQAVQRVSGVTVQDDKYVSVRGLGDRYTTSYVNGARVPSPEPEKRVVPLDMFPSGLLQSITTTKTFTPDQQGDFSGAMVDIKTREFPARRTWSAQLTSGYSAGATGAALAGARGTGGENFGMVNGGRDLPALLRGVGNFQGLTLNQGDHNLLVGSLRNAWSPVSLNGPAPIGGAFSVGGNDPLLFGHRIGYLLSGTFSTVTDLRDQQVRALADRGNTAGTTREIDRFSGQETSQSVLWGGIAQLSTMVGAGSRVTLNTIYNRTADNESRTETGSFENEGIRARITRMRYVERAVQSLQLQGEHLAGDRHRFDWAATSAAVSRSEPDRSEFVQAIERDTPTGPDVYRWVNSSNAGAVRTFSSLAERSLEGRANYLLNFRAFGASHSLKLGALTRTTSRDADTRAFSISANGASNAIRELSPEQLFDGRFTTATSKVFTISPLSQGGAYSARDHLSAGYLMMELGLSDRVRLIGGARVEHDQLDVHAASTLGSPVSTRKLWDDVLPSLAMNLRLNEQQQLRVSASRTLARPEYRELSPIKSRDVLNGDDTQGNENLERTRISNADVRWEWYPSSGELLSVGLFAKSFSRPIERVYRASGSGTRTVFYTNADRAENYGIELEARRDLGIFGRAFDPWTVFTNLTVMQSSIHLDPNTQASATNLQRRMVGQAPYIFNGGLSYTSRRGSTSATLLVNRIGERIEAAGDSPLPDVIEKARTSMDLSVRLGVTAAASVRLDAKNLLNTSHDIVQGTVTRESYRSGSTIQFGVQYRP